MFCLTLEEP